MNPIPGRGFGPGWGGGIVVFYLEEGK
jgi:hypothetical protein